MSTLLATLVPRTSRRALAVPTMMPRIQVDAGAIKYVFGGANVMCPGITNPGARARLRWRLARG